MVELGGADWSDVLLVLTHAEMERHAPLTPDRACFLRERIRAQLPELGHPSPPPLRFAVNHVRGPVAGPPLWVVLDVESNLIVATWQSQAAADADAWHRNRLAALEAAEDRSWIADPRRRG